MNSIFSKIIGWTYLASPMLIAIVLVAIFGPRINTHNKGIRLQRGLESIQHLGIVIRSLTHGEYRERGISRPLRIVNARTTRLATFGCLLIVVYLITGIFISMTGQGHTSNFWHLLVPLVLLAILTITIMLEMFLWCVSYFAKFSQNRRN